MIFKCTQKVRKVLKIRDNALDPINDMFYDELKIWYSNIIHLDRRKCILFTHEKSLFTFLIPSVSVAEIRRFGDLFRSNARLILMLEGFSEENIMKVIDIDNDQFAKADNRSILGSMNDHQQMCKYYLELNGKFENMNFGDINHRFNEAPMSVIGMNDSNSHLKELLSWNKKSEKQT